MSECTLLQCYWAVRRTKEMYITATLMYFSQILLLASNAGGWVGNVARMGRKKNAYMVLVRITEERDRLKTWA